MKIFEINEQYLKFLEMYETGEIDQETFNDTLESLNEDFKSKVSNLVHYVKNLEYEVAALKEEEKKMAERRKTKEKKIEGLKEVISTMMIVRNQNKLESNSFVLSYRKSSVVEVQEGFCEADYITEKVTYTVDKAKLKQDLKTKEVKGARIVEKRNLQIK